MSFKKVWSCNEFERFVVFSTIRLKGEVNFLIRELLQVFYFPNAFIVVIVNKNFLKEIFEKLQFYVSASDHWELSPSVCTNLKRSLIMENLSKIFLGRMQ